MQCATGRHVSAVATLGTAHAAGRILGTMLTIQAVSFDAHDPLALADFWREALGRLLRVDDDGDVVLEAPAGSPQDGVAADLLFLNVPEDKVIKNRIHLDLRPDDQAGEVVRLEGLGARRVSVGQGDEVTWIVMADPEGNEFCVLRAFRPDEV